MKFSFRKFRDLILGGVMLALSVFYLIFAGQIKTRPKLTPTFASAQRIPILLGILLAFLSILLIIQGIRKAKTYVAGDDEKKAGKQDLLTVALTFAIIIIYTILLPRVGFCIATMIYLFCQILILAPKEKRNYLLFAIIAVVFTMVVFVAFRIGLTQILPRGPIEALLGY